MASIQAATRAFEDWLKPQLPFVDKRGLDRKHEKMAAGAFEFLRGTFYRWMQRWPRIAGDLDDSPRVLAIGDLHVENFGTWRDAEGRLVWGINDFDEAYTLPYTLDLVRLATSALLTVETGHFAVGRAAVCSAIVEGYSIALDEGGRPIVLGEPENDWLRAIAQRLWRSWAPIDDLKRATRVPDDAKGALKRSAPRGTTLEFRKRRAGLGSLGKPRFVATGLATGGRIAREAKSVTRSAAAWVAGKTTPSRTMLAVRGAVRSPDPFYTVDGDWLVRRLAPDCGKLELGDDPLTNAEELLAYMGRETANVHLGTRGARERIRAHLKRRPERWLKKAAERAVEITIEDWKRWRG